MPKLGFNSCDTDMDLWMKPEFRPEDFVEYYSYISCNADDLICIHHDSDNTLKKLNVYVLLNPISVGSLDMFLEQSSNECNYIISSGHGR